MKACFQIFEFPFYFVGWLAPALQGSMKSIPAGSRKKKENSTFSYSCINKALFLDLLPVVDVSAIDNHVAVHHLLDDIP